MDNNLIFTLIGLAIPVIAGAITLFGKISKLEGRLDALASENRLQDKVDQIHDESIRKLQQVKQEIEQEVEALRQEKVSTRLAGLEVQVKELQSVLTPNKLWWYQLDNQWQVIFKEAIGIESEPTEDELVKILSLTELKCDNDPTSLEPLRGLKSLKQFHYDYGRPLMPISGREREQEKKRFKKAVPSCQLKSGRFFEAD